MHRSLNSLIEKEGFPHGFEPSRDKNIKGVIRNNWDDWGGMWGLAEYMKPDVKVVDIDESPSSVAVVVDRLGFDKARGELTRFWDTWASSLLNGYVDLQLDREELIVLVWLELAWHGYRLSKKTDFDVHGAAFFELAKSEWDSFLISRSRDSHVTPRTDDNDPWEALRRI